MPSNIKNSNIELPHYEGFEKEAHFWTIVSQALCDCPVLKVGTVKRIIAHVAPEFLDKLFDIRSCRRKLRYIGCHWVEDENFHDNDPNDFFKIGEVYNSIDFNGATYTIKGYKSGKRRIGYAYFERVT